MSNLANSTSLLLASNKNLSQILDQAYAHFSRGEWKEACSGLTHAVSHRPADAQLHAALGIVHFNLEEFRAAAAAFTTAVQLNPGSVELQTQLAMACIEIDQLDRAEEALHCALVLRPGEIPALKLLAGICTARGKTDEASTWTSRAENLEKLSNPVVGADAARLAYPENVPTQAEIKLDTGLSLELGACSYIYGNRIQNPSGALTHIRIGTFCSIATALTIIGYDHKTEWISTYPFLDTWHRTFFPGTAGIPYPAGQEFGGNINRGDITIGNDVWIGHDVKLLKGITIGDGAVIGACALVTKDVAPYSIVGGVPAKLIRQRFTDAEIKSLLRLAWWDWPVAKINQYLPYLCSSRIAELETRLNEGGSEASVVPPAVPASVSVAPVTAARRRQAQAVVEKFIEKARTYFKDVEPPRLTADHLANSRVLPIREDMLYHMPRGGVCAEIGTQTGYFAKFIMERTAPAKFHIYDLDFSPFDYPAFADPIQSGTVQLHQGDSATLLAQAPDKYFDFIYIDGDHAYEGVKRDLQQALVKVKDDGWILCNDYAPFSPLEQMKYGVYRAVNEFCLQHDFEIVYLALQKWGYHDVALRRMRRDKRAETKSVSGEGPSRPV